MRVGTEPASCNVVTLDTPVLFIRIKVLGYAFIGMGFLGPSNVLTLQDGMPTVGLCRFSYCEFTPKQRQLDEFYELFRRVF